ncbi:MAG TPA: hypothetical protein VNX68_05980 [Nitrosopumilaceae archaeon]|jgi:hypothetical protein|nr:hypothetical protein [Nitrosopumilaceae archaeon]
METKVCKKCNSEKSLEEFRKGKYNHRSSCKECDKEYNKSYKESHKKETKVYNKTYNEINKERNSKRNKSKGNIYYEEHKEEKKKYAKIKRANRNEEEKLAYNNYSKNHIKERSENDPLFKLNINIRSAIYNSIKSRGYKKNSKTAQILECTFQEFKTHIEKQFLPWMNWNNYGKYNGELNFGWDLDHIIPTSSAITEEDVIRLNNYINFQPLCSKINRDVKKGNLNYSAL